MHRVGVVLHRNRGRGPDPHPQPLAGIQPCGGKRSQPLSLFLKAPLSTGVELVEELPEEGPVLGTAIELPATAQHQLLVERHFETVVALLHVPILVAPARVGCLGTQPIVREQRLVAIGELSPTVGGGAADGGRKRVSAVALRSAPQLEESLLQTLREALETLGKADAARLPVGVGEGEVIQQVRKRPPGDRYPQAREVAEVGSAEIAGMVLLGEEDLPGRSLGRSPLLHLALQTTELPVRKAAGVLALEVGKQRRRLQAWVHFQQRKHLFPGLGKGILARSPGVWYADLARQSACLPISTRRLGIHAGLRRRYFQRVAGCEPFHQFPHLVVREHRLTPPVLREFAKTLAYDSINPGGNSNCRCSGLLIVPHQPASERCTCLH